MSEEKTNLDAAAAVRELLARQKLVDELTDRPDTPRHEPGEEAVDAQPMVELRALLERMPLEGIAQIIEKGHAAGIWVGMCGEMAGDPQAAALLLGMGLDEFSMNPPTIPFQKEILRKMDTQACAELAHQCLECASTEEVHLTLQTFLEKQH